MLQILDKVYTCAEVAERYKVKIKTVWEWIRSGTLVAVTNGRYYWIRESDLLAFEEARLTKRHAD